jgi:CubicO group peptidase (beta-lactamase class C family)
LCHARQLVEQGKIKLDEPVETIYPEINDHKMLDGSAPKTKITMRMLLSHTAGFSYTFFNQGILDYSRAAGNGDEFTPGNWDPFFAKMPLVNEPGTKWAYGINIDVAGKILEKITGQTLGAYSKEHIFEPLGCKEIAYGKCEYPERLASLHQIGEDGKITARGKSGYRKL